MGWNYNCPVVSQISEPSTVYIIYEAWWIFVMLKFQHKVPPPPQAWLRTCRNKQGVWGELNSSRLLDDWELSQKIPTKIVETHMHTSGRHEASGHGGSSSSSDIRYWTKPSVPVLRPKVFLIFLPQPLCHLIFRHENHHQLFFVPTSPQPCLSI